jgi:HEPN domain-containing protein
MKPLTDEWVRKAEGDFTAAKREYRARKEPNFDAACFHAQQCAEKYLKACLHESGIPVERTHNLVHLLDLILPAEPLWEGMRTSLVVLNNYAVVFRYPGEFADRETARDAIAICKDLREQARMSMRLLD